MGKTWVVKGSVVQDQGQLDRELAPAFLKHLQDLGRWVFLHGYNSGPWTPPLDHIVFIYGS